MQVIYETDTAQAAAAVGQRLQEELQAGKQVTWFVCGGSNIPLIVQSMAAIDPSLTAKLTILLSDERFGIPGHPDSNWKQLDDAGFASGEARVLRTLRPEATLDDTCKAYALDVESALGDADIVIAQLGVGGDGHIAGILPESDASRMTSDESPLVTGYDAGAFTRITITPTVFERIDVAYSCVYGETKHDALVNLTTKDLTITDQPAQLLKELPEAYIFTDQQL
jgi:6-phosphogluconolactonase/glucosamine-6-phosphate isomerase/deaminase